MLGEGLHVLIGISDHHRIDQDTRQLDRQPYLETLRGVAILEAKGRVDIPLLQKKLYQWISDSY